MNINQLPPTFEREPHFWQDNAFQAAATVKQGNVLHDLIISWYDTGVYFVSKVECDDVTGDIFKRIEKELPTDQAIETINDWFKAAS